MKKLYYSALNMKHMKFCYLKLFVFASFFCLFSCKASLLTEPGEDVIFASESFCDSRVTVADVRDYIRSLGYSGNVKSTNAPDISPVVSAADTVMYIVNYPEGWEVLSGDRRLGPVLIRCESGSVTEESLYSNPAMSAFLDGLVGTLDSLRQNPVPMSSVAPISNPNPPMSFRDENGVLWMYSERYMSSSSRQKQDPLLGLKWGQGTKNHSLYPKQKWNVCAPYDSPNRTSHCYMGCSPVAIAQVLYYLHGKNGIPASFYKNAVCTAYLASSSSSVTLSNSNTTFSSYGNYWSLMPASGATATDEGFSVVSAFMLGIGKELKSTYKYDGTSTPTSNFKAAFSAYGYNCKESSSFSASEIRNQIYTKKNPIVANISGTRYYSDANKENQRLDHTVVIDGYEYVKENYTYVYKNGDSGTFVYKYMPYTFEYEYFSCNWGYDGDGQYNASGDVIWLNMSNLFHRNFSGGHDSASMYGMFYDFEKK